MGEAAHIKNIFEPGMGMGGAGLLGGGAGLGAGLIGGALGGALFRNGLGGWGGEGFRGHDCVTPMQLASSTASIIDANQNTTLLQAVGDVKAAVPLAEAQVQLALAGAQNALSNQIGQQSISLVQGFSGVQQNISSAQASIIAVGESVKDTVNATSAATQLAIANSIAQGLQNTNVIVTAVRDDGDKTRALIVAQNEAGLRNEITALQIRLQEQQNESRARGTEVNVTQNVAQNQAQAQAQQQQQQQAILLNHLCTVVGGLQNAVATNSNLIVGNTGAVATGTQTANPVNVRA